MYIAISKVKTLAKLTRLIKTLSKLTRKNWTLLSTACVTTLHIYLLIKPTTCH